MEHFLICSASGCKRNVQSSILLDMSFSCVQESSCPFPSNHYREYLYTQYMAPFPFWRPELGQFRQSFDLLAVLGSIKQAPRTCQKNSSLVAHSFHLPSSLKLCFAHKIFSILFWLLCISLLAEAMHRGLVTLPVFCSHLQERTWDSNKNLCLRDVIVDLLARRQRVSLGRASDKVHFVQTS